MTPRQQEIYDLYNKLKSKSAVAQELKISRRSVRVTLDRVRKEIDAPEGVRSAIKTTGTEGVALGGWRIIRHADGSRESVRWELPKSDLKEEPEDILERITDRLDRIQPSPFIQSPQNTRSDIRNFIPLFDVHLSMRIGEYGTAQAVERLQLGSQELLRKADPAECTIILNGGDFTHQNDGSNLTPRSQHPLPVDAEYEDTTDVAIEVTETLISTALEHSDHVIYKALKGNHDPNTARILRAALRARYRKEPRVTIEVEGLDFFAHHWGKNLICAHHGDIRKKPQDMVLGFAAKYPQMWGGSTYRDLWTGHLHHLDIKEYPGMVKNQVRAICPGDRHSEEELYISQSEMMLRTYKRSGGRLTDHFFGY